MFRIQEPALEEILRNLRERDEFVFLDTSRPDRENNQSYLFVDPVERCVCRYGDDLEKYLLLLQEKLDKGYFLAGWVAYEFGSLLEAGLPVPRAGYDPPKSVLADFGVFLEPFHFDHNSGSGNLMDTATSLSGDAEFCVSDLHPNMEKQEFLDAIDKVQGYIGAGDTYQVNYTLKLLFQFQGDVTSFYKMLRRNQSVPYGAYIRNGAEHILSFSPELFFRKERDGLMVRPMKGTAARGRNSAEDYGNCRMLHLDGKNRSENVMIVDLLRNDLARLIACHSQPQVETVSLFDVEAYESLLQMTSTVKASSSSLDMAGLSLKEIFHALFPCGSITGAPKIRTMEIIDELEKEPRGVYTGAIGYFGPKGQAMFNVPIRTVRLEDGAGEMGIGAGITYGSVPEDEWEESLLKGKFLTEAKPVFQIFETILWEEGKGFWLLEHHLERMAESALFYKFAYHEKLVKQALKDATADSTDPFLRVRLCLEKDGRVRISVTPCDEPLLRHLPETLEGLDESDLPSVRFAPEKVESDQARYFHKTTQRQMFDTYMKKAAGEGLFDYIFCNEKGDVTEGSYTNVFIHDGHGYVTPRVTSGLLAGTMRRQLLADGKGQVREAVLSTDDLRSATALFLCNSVRGVVRVRLEGQIDMVS